LLTTGYKRLTEGGHEAVGFWLFDGESFWMWEAFWMKGSCWIKQDFWKKEDFDGGVLAEGKLLEGDC
jgi:hypothetical protein